MIGNLIGQAIKLAKECGVRPLVLTLILVFVIGGTVTIGAVNHFVTRPVLAESNKMLDQKFSHELENKVILLAQADEDIQSELKSEMKQQKLDTLYLQQQMVQQQVWDLDARVDDSKDNEKKEKWDRRLKRAEKDLEKIEEKIENTKDNEDGE